MASTSTLKEYPLNLDPIKNIPEKVHLTFTSIPLHITCFDVSNTHILLGTNAGCAFLHNREMGHIIKVLCQDKHDNVSSVKLLAGLQCQVAMGTRQGRLTITALTSGYAGSKQVQKFELKDIHKSEVCCLAWSTNGMKLFSADRLGVIYLADVDLNLNTCTTSFVLRENSEIIQMEYRHKVLLVATLEHTFLMLNEETRMIGSKPFRKGRYGSCFNADTTHQDELQVYAARPGLRIWISNMNGNVVSTLKMKELVNSSSCTITLKDAYEAHEKEMLFGRVYTFGLDCLVAYHGSSIYVINHREGTIIGEVHNLPQVIQVEVNEMEIFALCSDKQLHRIAYMCDETGKGYNAIRDEGEKNENASFNEMKETLTEIKKKVFSPLQSKMPSLNIDDVTQKIHLQAKDLKRKVASIPIRDVTDLRIFSDHKTKKKTNVEDDCLSPDVDGSSDLNLIVKDLLEDMICKTEESLKQSRDNPHVDVDDATNNMKFFRIETVDVNELQNDIVFSSKLRRRKHRKSSPRLSTKSESHVEDSPQMKDESSSFKGTPLLPVFASDRPSNSEEGSGEDLTSDVEMEPIEVGVTLEKEIDQLKSDNDLQLLRDAEDAADNPNHAVTDTILSINETKFLQEKELHERNNSSLSNEQFTETSLFSVESNSAESLSASSSSLIGDDKNLAFTECDAHEKKSRDFDEMPSDIEESHEDSSKDNVLLPQHELEFDIYETEESRDFASEKESSDEDEKTREIPGTSKGESLDHRTNEYNNGDVCDDKYFNMMTMNSELYGNSSLKLADTWVVVNVPSSAPTHSLSGSSDLICCVNNEHSAYCTEEGYEVSYHLVWNKIVGKASHIAISPSGDFAWLVSSEGTLFAASIPVHLTDDPSHPTNIHLNWSSVSENISHVCLGASSGWAIDLNGHLLLQQGLSRLHPHDQLFKSVDVKVFNKTSSADPIKVQTLSLTENVVWILSSAGHLFCKLFSHVSTSGKWEQVDLPQVNGKNRRLKFLTSDYINTMWVVDVNGDLWFRSKVTERFPKGHDWWQVYMNEYLHQNKHLPFKLPHAVARLNKHTNMWATNPVSVHSVVVGSKSIWVSTNQRKVHIARGSIIGTNWKFTSISGVAPSTRWSHITSSSIFSPEAGGWNDIIWVAQSRGEMVCFVAHSDYSRVVAVAPPEVEGSQLVSLSASRETLWVVFESGKIYARSGISPATPAGIEWKRVNISNQLGSKRLVHVNCGTNCVWAIDQEGSVYVRMGVTVTNSQDTMAPAWLSMGQCELSGSKFTQITCGPSDINVWALDSQGNSHVRAGVTSDLPVGKSWKVVPGPCVKQVAISNHTVWGLSQDGEVLRRCGITQNDCEGDYWMSSPGSMKMLTVTPSDRLWAIDNQAKLRHYVTFLYYPPLLGAMRDDIEADDMTYNSQMPDCTSTLTEAVDETTDKELDQSWEVV